MTTPDTPGDTPLVTLTITPIGGTDEVNMQLNTHGISVDEAAALLRQALINLDQRLWETSRGLHHGLTIDDTRPTTGQITP